jgi:hypothetical protein
MYQVHSAQISPEARLRFGDVRQQLVGVPACETFVQDALE